MTKYSLITLFKTKNNKYELEKHDLWQMVTIIALGAVPLFTSIFKYTSPRTTFIISSLIFVILIFIALYVFVEKSRINTDK